MGSNSSKCQESSRGIQSVLQNPYENEPEIEEETATIPTTPVLTPQASREEIRELNIDPRSPSKQIARTPIELLSAAALKLSELTIQSSETDKPTIETPLKNHLILGIDPRSPSIEIQRTPIVVSASPDRKFPSVIRNKNLEKVKNIALLNTPISASSVPKQVAPRLLSSQPATPKVTKTENTHKRKSFALLETNIDFTETDLDMIIQQKYSGQDYEQSNIDGGLEHALEHDMTNSIMENSATEENILTVEMTTDANVLSIKHQDDEFVALHSTENCVTENSATEKNMLMVGMTTEANALSVKHQDDEFVAMHATENCATENSATENNMLAIEMTTEANMLSVNQDDKFVAIHATENSVDIAYDGPCDLIEENEDIYVKSSTQEEGLSVSTEMTHEAVERGSTVSDSPSYLTEVLESVEVEEQEVDDDNNVLEIALSPDILPSIPKLINSKSAPVSPATISSLTPQRLIKSEPVTPPAVNLTADVKELDKKLTNLIYEDEDPVVCPRAVVPKGQNRTPLKLRNGEEMQTNNIQKLKVSDKPRKQLSRSSKIPVFKDKKIKVQCENTPPRNMHNSNSKKPHWDPKDETLFI